MTPDRARFASAAEALVGTPFRFRGRDRETGFDCVGLVLAALAEIGRPARGLTGHSMRHSSLAGHAGAAPADGFEPAAGPIELGDLVLARPGPAQVHLLIAATAGGFVHAHAGLGRVVLTPPPCPWPIERHWRLAAD